MLGFVVKKRDAVRVPSFTPSQMRTAADVASREEMRRIRSALNINDSTAKPLSPQYAEQKRRQGLSPVRNLSETGAMLASRTVAEADSGSATVEFSDARQQSKAEANELIEPMLGVSPQNQIAVDQKMHEQFQANVEAVNR